MATFNFNASIIDNYMFFALADGQFKQKFGESYSVPAIRVSIVPNFVPVSAGGFSLSQTANGKSSSGDAFKNN